MADGKLLPGKFVWFELISREAKKAQAFYGEVLGWKVQSASMGQFTYEMIQVGDKGIGGYVEPRDPRQPAHWISYVSVENVDALVKVASANGGKVIEPPSDIPNVGRFARIADPQGAEICPFTSATDDPPDALPPAGAWMWNELHVPDAAKALQFYEKVFGFTNRGMPSPAGGTYYILSRNGVDRAGVSTEMPKGAAPHWMPYVNAQDADATLARARRLGATICVGPENIPGVGRFGVLRDPVGASLAIMKPMPMQK